MVTASTTREGAGAAVNGDRGQESVRPWSLAWSPLSVFIFGRLSRRTGSSIGPGRL